MNAIQRLLLALVFATLAGTAFAQAPFRAETPVVVTSSGQSLDAFTVKTMLGRAGVANDYNPRLEPSQLGAAKTLIIAFGASVKGFGTAGVTAETELVRTRALLKAARERKMAVIGVHVGGSERRKGLSEAFVDLVTPAVDYLVVWDEGNADRYFDKVAGDKKIPLTLIQQPMEVGKVLAQAFGR